MAWLKNKKTGITIEFSGQAAGEDWEPVESGKKATKKIGKKATKKIGKKATKNESDSEEVSADNVKLDDDESGSRSDDENAGNGE